MNTAIFRPTDTSSEAVKQAILKASAARQDAQARHDRALEARDANLLDGSPRQREAAQAALREARDDLEQLDAVVSQLHARLALAIREETVGAVTQRLAEIGAVNERANAFWSAKGPTMQKLLDEATQLVDDLGTAEMLLLNARHRAADYGDDPRVYAVGAPVEISEEANRWMQALSAGRTPG